MNGPTDTELKRQIHALRKELERVQYARVAEQTELMLAWYLAGIDVGYRRASITSKLRRGSER